MRYLGVLSIDFYRPFETEKFSQNQCKLVRFEIEIIEIKTH